MSHNADVKRYEELFRPHMNAAYNLARWLTGNDSAAHDVVQESALRAFKYLSRFAGGNARAWLLAIVRNQSFTWLKQSKENRWVAIGDEMPEDDLALSHADTPELSATLSQNKELLAKALLNVPPQFREVIVLKELEDLSYKDIAAIADIPLGTVMSRLARGRAMLKTELLKLYPHE